LGSRKAEQATAAFAGWTPEMRLFWNPLIGNGWPILVSNDVVMTIDKPFWRLRNSEINDPEDLPGSRKWQELSKKLGKARQCAAIEVCTRDTLSPFSETELPGRRNLSAGVMSSPVPR
jgi:hypothetical protein